MEPLKWLKSSILGACLTGVLFAVAYGADQSLQYYDVKDNQVAKKLSETDPAGQGDRTSRLAALFLRAIHDPDATAPLNAALGKGKAPVVEDRPFLVGGTEGNVIAYVVHNPCTEYMPIKKIACEGAAVQSGAGAEVETIHVAVHADVGPKYPPSEAGSLEIKISPEEFAKSGFVSKRGKSVPSSGKEALFEFAIYDNRAAADIPRPEINSALTLAVRQEQLYREAATALRRKRTQGPDAWWRAWSDALHGPGGGLLVP